MFWYMAKNEEGRVGIVPSNFLEPLEEGIFFPFTRLSSRAVCECMYANK